MKKLISFLILALLLPVSAFAVTAVPAAHATTGMVSASGTGLVRPDGGSFFIFGGNYVGGADRSWTMWQDGLFDASQIESDFSKAKAAGLNTIRLFVRSPLNQEIAAGKWTKLDTVVSLAEKYSLYLIVTLYDYGEVNLAKVASIDGAIAARYAGKSCILAYDLKNEPHFQDLATAQYTSAPPLQTNVLVQHYGQKMSQEEVDAWRKTSEGSALIPSRFSSQEAYYYANNYQLYKQFISDAGTWVAAHNYTVSSLDYMDSSDSAKWSTLIDAMSQTLAAWMKPQMDAIRAVDSSHLLTIGYSDFMLAKLSANNSLSFASFHRYPNTGASALKNAFDLFSDLQRAFPSKPMFLGEFGFSNASLDRNVTSQFETALMLHAMSQGMAGVAKWSLYDVAQGYDATQMNYGMYAIDGAAKQIVYASRALGDYVGSGAPSAGALSIQDSSGGLSYVYSSSDALFVAAPGYTDAAGRMSFEASGNTQVFLSWRTGNQINVLSTGAATLHINLSTLLGINQFESLKVLNESGTEVAFQRQDNTITFGVEANKTYRVTYANAALDARIEIVWPQGNKSVSEAVKANIGTYLFGSGTTKAICTGSTPTVRLWRALNSGVEEEVGTATTRGVTVNGTSFNSFDFNDVDVSAAQDGQNKYYFRVSIDGKSYRSSIWSHGEDARTYLPNPEVPTSVGTTTPSQVDAKIQIVWPHDNLPVSKATQVNIGIALFEHGTLQSVSSSWTPTVRLWRSLNNGYETQVAVGHKVTKTSGSISYPAWEFNDIDVSAANDPLNKYYFRVTVDSVTSYSNIWSHGSDARTYFPEQDVPSGVNTCN